MTSVGLGACGGGGWTLVMKKDGTKVYLLRITTVCFLSFIAYSSVAFFYEEITHNQVLSEDLRQIKQNTRKSVSRLQEFSSQSCTVSKSQTLDVVIRFFHFFYSHRAIE